MFKKAMFVVGVVLFLAIIVSVSFFQYQKTQQGNNQAWLIKEKENIEAEIQICKEKIDIISDDGNTTLEKFFYLTKFLYDYEEKCYTKQQITYLGQKIHFQSLGEDDVVQHCAIVHTDVTKKIIVRVVYEYCDKLKKPYKTHSGEIFFYGNLVNPPRKSFRKDL